jgi:uncharacterized membrane protein SirB2
MDSASLYPLVKSVHLLCVALSLSLFAARWLGGLAGAAWPLGPVARRGSVAIDTALLCAGVSLWWLGGWNPWHHPWLGAKLLSLVVYVGLGSWALKRAQSRRGRGVFGLLALAVASQMVGMALHHHPAGWWAP